MKFNYVCFLISFICNIKKNMRVKNVENDKEKLEQEISGKTELQDKTNRCCDKVKVAVDYKQNKTQSIRSTFSQTDEKEKL